jgi:hypothetical protein
MKRTLKINSKAVKYSATLHKHKRTVFMPALNISGKWFEALGFTIGSQVEIMSDGSTLTIRKK